MIINIFSYLSYMSCVLYNITWREIVNWRDHLFSDWFDQLADAH